MKAGTWPPGLKAPTSMDLILLFIGKSTWYDLWSKTFPTVAKYPEMVKWLKCEEDCKSDLEVCVRATAEQLSRDLAGDPSV